MKIIKKKFKSLTSMQNFQPCLGDVISPGIMYVWNNSLQVRAFLYI